MISSSPKQYITDFPYYIFLPICIIVEQLECMIFLSFHLDRQLIYIPSLHHISQLTSVASRSLCI